MTPDPISISLRMSGTVQWFRWSATINGRRVVAFSRSAERSPLAIAGATCERVT